MPFTPPCTCDRSSSWSSASWESPCSSDSRQGDDGGRPERSSGQRLRRQPPQLFPHALDQLGGAAFVAEAGELLLLVGQLAAEVVEAPGGEEVAGAQGAQADAGLAKEGGGGAVLPRVECARRDLFGELDL